MPLTKLEISGYKCFDKETQFDEPKLVNLIIGKNNSGKSSFLNVISHIYCGTDLKTEKPYSFYYLLEKNYNFFYIYYQNYCQEHLFFHH